jgi:hypothetical protein
MGQPNVRFISADALKSQFDVFGHFHLNQADLWILMGR